MSHTLYGCVYWNKDKQGNYCAGMESHPIWVCVLKHPSRCPQKIVACHTLYGVCVLKHSVVGLIANNWMSHPIWVCVLKRKDYEADGYAL